MHQQGGDGDEEGLRKEGADEGSAAGGGEAGVEAAG